MKFLWLSLLAATSLSSAQGYEMKSYVRLQGFEPAAFWCDAPGRVLAVTQPKRTGGAAQSVTQPVELLEWAGSDYSVQDYQLGPTDAGAGNLYTALTPSAMPVRDAPTFFIHSSNIENAADPQYRMTHILEFKVPSGTFRCRYKPQAAFVGATALHSVTIWEHQGKVTYASTNHNGTPGVYLTGGQHSGNEYRWHKGGYTYLVKLSFENSSLIVLRGNTVLSNESFQAYSVSVRK